MNRIKGLELLFDTQKTRIRSKADCVVAAIHCMLLEENLLCVGSGEDFSESEDATQTELLPNHWNDDQECYTLRYSSRDDQDRLLLKIVSSDHALYVNVLVNGEYVFGMTMDVDRYISDDFGDYGSAYRDLNQLVVAFTTGILENLRVNVPQNNPESSNTRWKEFPKPSKTVPNFNPQDPIDDEEFSGVPNPPRARRNPKVGEQDRQPGGRGQGGMHFDPSSLEGEEPTPVKPQGKKGDGTPKVPPGARHDPIGPVKGPNKGKPNPDHFKPPNNDDDDYDNTFT